MTLLALLAIVSTPPVYTPSQAIADALSSPLEYVGRGPWFGMARWESCVYRNQTVMVVDIYCAKAWPRAFSVIVFSPTRGRAKLYLESETPAGELPRERYDESLWKIESEPPPTSAQLPARVRLTMSFEELRDYEEARYQLYLPACYTAGATGRCHRDLTSARDAWAKSAEPFWKQPGKPWKRLIHRIRDLAKEHGT